MKNGDKVIEFNQKAWLNPYIDMNEHSANKKYKKSFLKDYFKLMNIAVFGNTIGNVRKYKGMKLVTTGYERDYLVSEPTII